MNLFNFYIPEEILVALSLIILVLVLTRILWKPLMKIIDSRQEGIDDSLRGAEEARKVVADMEEQRAKHDADLERQTLEKMKEARELAGREYDRIIADAEAKARKFTEAAEEKARRAFEQSMAESQETIIATALTIASKIIETSVDTEKNREYIISILQKAGASHD